MSDAFALMIEAIATVHGQHACLLAFRRFIYHLPPPAVTIAITLITRVSARLRDVSLISPHADAIRY